MSHRKDRTTHKNVPFSVQNRGTDRRVFGKGSDIDVEFNNSMFDLTMEFEKSGNSGRRVNAKLASERGPNSVRSRTLRTVRKVLKKQRIRKRRK